MNSRYVKLHVISNPFVSGGGGGGGDGTSTSIATSLDESLDDDVFVPSVSLLKQYVQNASLGTLFGNGTHLSFVSTGIDGKLELDIIGPEGSLTSKQYTAAYDSLIFDPTDFHMTSVVGGIRIQNNAIKYVSVDNNPEHLSERVSGLNFRSNRNIRITNQIENDKHNLYFHLLRYNDIYGLVSDAVIPSASPNTTVHKFIWDELIHDQEIVLDSVKRCYVYTGTSDVRAILHFQFLYQWVDADLPYRFRLDIYTMLNGQKYELYCENVGLTNLFDVINSYTNTLLVQLSTNEEIHFEIIHDTAYSLKIMESSYFYTEYIE